MSSLVPWPSMDLKAILANHCAGVIVPKRIPFNNFLFLPDVSASIESYKLFLYNSKKALHIKIKSSLDFSTKTSLNKFGSTPYVLIPFLIISLDILYASLGDIVCCVGRGVDKRSYKNCENSFVFNFVISSSNELL